MRISDWSAYVCSSDLVKAVEYFIKERLKDDAELGPALEFVHFACTSEDINNLSYALMLSQARQDVLLPKLDALIEALRAMAHERSEEHTSELQSLMRISYAVFCLKKKKYTLQLANLQTHTQPL